MAAGLAACAKADVPEQADVADAASATALVADAGPDLPCPPIPAVIRDFREDHPDMEVFVGMAPVPGVVAPMLGEDGLPVYLPEGATAATTGKAEFDQWYRDVAGVNLRFERAVQPTLQEPGRCRLVASPFFPIDGVGFPNQQNNVHNFHFTTMLRWDFTYTGGDTMEFGGDDDVWVFINRRLAVDIGGTHGHLSQTIAVDELRAALALEVGNTYEVRLFHAERRSDGSSLVIDTPVRPGVAASGQ
jgi:fibro-slime domain-containing protein